MYGSHFREYHLLLDEQATELFDATDAIAERARKIGETTLRSIADITRYQRLSDSDINNAPAFAMLQCLCDDNVSLANFMRETHEACDAAGDLATASLLENWIDEAERRSWFLSATINSAGSDRRRCTLESRKTDSATPCKIPGHLFQGRTYQFLVSSEDPLSIR